VTVQDVFRRALIVKCLRPDRVLPSLRLFIDKIFGSQMLSSKDLQLNKLVTDEIKSNTPVSFCSVPGLDASSRVDALAQELKVSCTSVAIGSIEGYGLADKAISTASKQGGWVLLKNVHLAPQWLAQLEKKIHNLTPHPTFRLFMTMEINPKVPASILRMSRIVMFENPPGIKANLQEALGNLQVERVNAQPIERARLHFMLGWFHAVVQERLRYVPLGWTKIYEFNDSDQKSATDIIDSWIDNVGKERTNISPDKIPWDALRTLLSQSIYGGRIDNEFDQKLLECFVDHLFNAQIYNSDFTLADNVTVPEGSVFEHFREWVEKLPDRQPPTWLGLPKNAEKVLLVSQGNALLSRVRNMKSLADDDDDEEEAGTQGNEKGANRNQPLWMRLLLTSVNSWLSDIQPV